MATWKKVLLNGLDLSGSDVTNNHIGITDGTNSTDVTIGNDITFLADGDLSVEESNGTITYSFNAGATTNSFATITPSSGDSVVAESSADTLTLTGGNAITITGVAATDTLTVAVTDGAIDTDELADNAVTTAKITDGNVTFAKMAGAAVITAAESIASNDDDSAFPTAAAVIDYVAAQITAEDLDVAGDSGTGSVDLDSQSLTIAGTSNEIETSASGQTITIGLPNDVTIGNDLTVTGNLTVSGTTTTINTTNLTVEDKLIKLADVTTPSTTTGNGAGIQVEVSATEAEWPELKWDNAGELTGWTLADYTATENVDYPVAIMKFDNVAGIPGAGEDEAGVGSFVMNTADDALYLRVA